MEGKNNFHIVAFMDKSKCDEQSEFVVLQPDELKNLVFDNILITSEKWFENISGELQEKYEINKEKIIHLSELVCEEKYFCNLCDSKIPFMLDSGIKSPVFSKRKIVGGGFRKNCICPYVGEMIELDG